MQILYLHLQLCPSYCLNFLSLLLSDLLTSLPNLNASASVRVLLDLNFFKNSKSFILCIKACLATSDQFISGNFSILSFSSDGTAKVIVVMFFNLQLCVNMYNMFRYINFTISTPQLFSPSDIFCFAEIYTIR